MLKWVSFEDSTRRSGQRPYLERRCAPFRDVAQDDFWVVVLEHAQQTGQAGVAARLPQEGESVIWLVRAAPVGVFFSRMMHSHALYPKRPDMFASRHESKQMAQLRPAEVGFSSASARCVPTTASRPGPILPDSSGIKEVEQDSVSL